MINSVSAQTIQQILTTDYPNLYDGFLAVLKDGRESRNVTAADTIEFVRSGTLPNVVDPPYSFTNPIPASGIIQFDSEDEYSVQVWSQIIRQFSRGIATADLEGSCRDYALFVQGEGDPIPDVNLGPFADGIDIIKCLAHFAFSVYFYQDERNTTLFCRLAAERLNVWHRFFIEKDNIFDQESLEKLAAIEDTLASEEEEILKPIGEDDISRVGADNFSYIIDKLSFMAGVSITSPGVNLKYKTEEQIAGFFRTFSKIDRNALSNIDTVAFSNFYMKLIGTGILELASYASDISRFARRRFVNKERLERPLYDEGGTSDTLDEVTDLPWLLLLTDVVQKLRRDPITFAGAAYHFPSLITFLIDALAAIGDYTNNGKGGAEDAQAFVNSLERAFGVNEDGRAIFQMAFKTSSTAERIKAAIQASPFRSNIAPASPDVFHLRLGAANFYVPPVSIDVNSTFKTGSLTGTALRQKNSPKFNSGYKETTVRMRLFFPNYQEIWGMSIDDASAINVNEDLQIDFRTNGDSEQKIDKFLSSLRGLVAAFRYSPILPIKNQYLNRVHGITAVALSSMSVSTIPNFPFALAVDIELLNYNHEPFLPMIKDFNQAVHWGKYRQYMGRAAGALHKYVNDSFLLKTSDSKTDDSDEGIGIPSEPVDPTSSEESPEAEPEIIDPYYNQVYTYNIGKEWEDGNNIVFYVPAETQTKMFLPDNASFRSEQEKLSKDLGENFWERILRKIGIDIVDDEYGLNLDDVEDISKSNAYLTSDKDLIKNSIDILTAGVNTDDGQQKVYEYFALTFVQQNSNKLTQDDRNYMLDYNDRTDNPTKAVYYFNNLALGQDANGISLGAVKTAFRSMAINPRYFLDWLAEQKGNDIERRTGERKDPAVIKQELARAFNVTLYERFFSSGTIQAIMEANRDRNGNFHFNEWEVPMLRVEFDRRNVIVTGVSVGLSNKFAKLQIQMQDEPTYQHIGGGDSTVNLSMTVIGETELIRIKNMFDHISGLARLEHATGVLGFMGVKNIVTALCGLKYVLPLSYSVNTVPNYPHVYNVEMSFVDFDIFQQTREKLNSNQQRELVEHFSKKNPFLRIKQLWASFNAYPDFPLEVRDEQGDVVGHLDPDFYFRSFEMFDRDVINNIKDQTPRVQDYILQEGEEEDTEEVTEIKNNIRNFIRLYQTVGVSDSGAAGSAPALTLAELVNQITEYFRSTGISFSRFMFIFDEVVSETGDGFEQGVKQRLLTDYLNLSGVETGDNEYLEQVNPAQFKVGELAPNAFELRQAIEAMLAGEYSLADEQEVSFDPDEVSFHKLIHAFPAGDEESVANDQIPATCITAIGTYFGYINKGNGRFYLTEGGGNLLKDPNNGSTKLKPNLMDDTQTPDKGNTATNAGVPGTQAFSQYQKPYEQGTLYGQMEKMMVDTSYRDISGRMLRAFPTYMLWLIDEGGYFAGVKLFDNFYGLQSVVDFSVVTSEDLLGDTLVLRVSNLYSKLTTPESSKIFNPNLDTDEPTLSDSLTSIVERTLNISRNILSHMRNEYIVDIANIRLKPGVRVHLRGGYGSNPNSLQTLFNGIITTVEPGEIVTITAQSDAIELGAVINSTNKGGDSGKIDGGINTGLWMSEPRDLMVRLLTMGASRFREAISRSVRGTVFSENRFGIRHFGSILYEPLNKSDQQKADAMREKVAGAMRAIGDNRSIASKAMGAATSGFVFNIRGGGLDIMQQLWSNFSSEVDLEIFKRNIYPGNGTGIAQFLGGDIDDGWLTAASLTESDTYNERLDGHLGRLTDNAWNNLVASSQQGVPGSEYTLDTLAQEGGFISINRGDLVKSAFLGGGAGGVLGTAVMPNPLLGILKGRGGTNVFRTLGIISANDDDDLPGFDEVSFRAQTYMRTVWDLFQTCARMLPNYIVAVRPFEDRSTVFYGKPHWLYTSGVVPVTTGYPNEERAIELGIVTPKTREPDEDLTRILDAINRSSNPVADYSAYFQSFERSDSFESIASQIANSSGVYAPTSRLAGKVYDFYSMPSTKYINTKGEIEAKMPVSKGKVMMGLHLPIITESNKVEDSLSIQIEKHKQLDNLPPRFRFPFFAATESLRLEGDSIYGDDRSEIYGSVDLGSFLGQFAVPTIQTYNNLLQVSLEEFKFFDEKKITLEREDEIILDVALNLSELNGPLADQYFPTSQVVRMPIPNIGKLGGTSGSATIITAAEYNRDDYSWEYSEGIYGQITYTEWGAPTTTEDEQFYIAMRWPYQPAGSDNMVEAFKAAYGFDDLYGGVGDYKKRKVLVYNPSNGRAVVCRPAYFMWGVKEGERPDNDVSAVVSPDAAYFLGIITKNPGESTDLIEQSGFRAVPEAQDCYMGFISDDVPVGVVATTSAPVTKFKLENGIPELIDSDEEYFIGFGQLTDESEGTAAVALSQKEIEAIKNNDYSNKAFRDPLTWFKNGGEEFENIAEKFRYGGNPTNIIDDSKTYFEAVIDGEFDALGRNSLSELLAKDFEENPDRFSGKRTRFISVFTPTDQVAVQAASYYFEDFDPEVNVIAGDGRSLKDADNIWNEFRYLYHTSSSAKSVWADVFGMDPENDEPFPEYMSAILTGKDPTEDGKKPYIAKYGGTPTEEGGEAVDSTVDNFAILLGSEYLNSLPSAGYGDAAVGGRTRQDYLEALEFARSSWIDAPSSEGGLVEYFNNVIVKQLQAIHETFLSPDVLESIFAGEKVELTTENVTPKKLFHLMVGVFRQRMWEDPYARAWLVLKPDRKRGFLSVGGGDNVDGHWSFRPVDKIFREFINPYNDLAKPSKKQKFLQLLTQTKSEGNSQTDIILDAVDGIGNFFQSNIGPIWNALTDGLSGLLSMFKLNMQQMGYAMSEVGALSKQAHILNKALNDSIYYSLGRPGSLLRAVDNPFTREYGEPVIEIREPFQRLHYLSSFSNIISNGISENINSVATVITAVSDGKYPVTVALDKSAPAERQVEATVETGIYYDNMIGSGFFGFLHPIMHPLQTIRGVAKNAQGTPDELVAKRIALAHLKESIKDIYGGELVIIGNADIRPHDLVYLSDIYERMYGIFEVEQVVHHFTPELGFITSITPNALVSVNDPARWYMTSWFDSWMNTQTIRNDTRLYLNRGSSGIMNNGDLNLEALGESLNPQIIGGLQYTHGSTALAKDLISNQLATSLPTDRDEYLKNNAKPGISTFGLITAGITAGLAAAVPLGGALMASLAWKGWKWIRDNVLDQHGCYVQYLNKNGQPMDAGLSFNQGMVVGRYHSKALLPGILGVRSKVRTPEGYAYIRSDDILKNLGWQEKDISSLVRYTSYENALVHARVLKLSGLGPEKAGLEQQFKVIAKAVSIVDGDTIDFQDVLSSSGTTFRVRFDGINTAELNDVRGTIGYSEPNQTPIDIGIIDTTTPGGQAKAFVQRALAGKLVVLRINESRRAQVTPTNEAYDAGSVDNQVSNYVVDIFDRVLATIFYYLPLERIEKIKLSTSGILRNTLTRTAYGSDNGFDVDVVEISSISATEFKAIAKENFISDSVFYAKFDDIYRIIQDTIELDFWDYNDPGDLLFGASTEIKSAFNTLVYMFMLEEIYEKASQWPLTSWDEYYEDGQPVTLNWELVVNNLAKVYINELQTESDSVQTGDELMGMPESVD